VPYAPARPCGHPGGCGNYAGPDGYCDEHHSDLTGRRAKTAERGYDAAWRRFRAWFLRRHPICVGTGNVPTPNWLPLEIEMRAACGRAASEVHHIKRLAEFPALRCVEGNCLPQCESCHAKRTARGE